MMFIIHFRLLIRGDRMIERHQGIMPLSGIQEAYYIGRNESFELGGKSAQVLYEFNLKLDAERFEVAFNNVVKRHPMLRTIIMNEMQQKILQEVPYYSILKEDISDKSIKEQCLMLQQCRQEMFNTVFKTDKWPLFEIKLIKINEEEKHLLMSFDLLIADGNSLLVMIRDILAYYYNKQAQLPTFTRSYESYVNDKREYKLTSKRYIKDRAYWREKIKEIPLAPVLPEAYGMQGDNAVKRVMVTIKKELWGKVKDQATRHGVSPTVAVLCAYTHVLGHWSEQKNFTINMTLTEKVKYKMEDVIGDFTTSILIPVYEEDRALEFWKAAKQLMYVFMEAYKHSSFEGVEVIKEIARSQQMEGLAVMPIVFTSMLFKEDLFKELEGLGELVFSISRTPQVLLDCQVEESNGNLIITWDYIEDRLDAKVIRRMVEQMKSLIELVGNSTEKVDEIFQLSDKEYATWEYFNTSTDNEYYNHKKERNLLAFFKEAVAKYPNEKALTDKRQSVTYKQLNVLANEVAYELAEKGIGQGCKVGVSTEKCISTIANILGILKAGAVYVPIAYDFPEERKRIMMQKSECSILLTPFKGEIGSLKEIKDIWANIEEEDLAYIIFTSGSTGEPKGVEISHVAAWNTILGVNQKFKVTKKDVFIGLSSLSFDLSVYDLFGAFQVGAEVVLVEDIKDTQDIKRILIENKITVWNSVPSIAELLTKVLSEGYKNIDLRLMLLSGDFIPINLPDKLKSYFTNLNLISLGGATEAGIWSIYYPITTVESHWKAIPYGYPLPNQSMYVLDAQQKLCHFNTKGEIYIGGVSLAKGYVNDIAKTEAAFINHKVFKRLYKTGDYGKLHEDGYIEIVGRIDKQVKISGYRIEISEIEGVALKYRGVERVIVQPNEMRHGLCMFIETNEDIDIGRLSTFLYEQLPHYMVPQQIVQMSHFPLNYNGKIDKAKLFATICEHQVQMKKPETPLQKFVLNIWREVLGQSEIGITQTFFELGGDSLKAIQIKDIIEQQGYHINMKHIYEHNTIEKIAAYLGQGQEEKQIQEDMILGEL